MEAIRCHELSRRYGQVEALKPLDLVIDSGSVFGFLGRNGAGKTTTIRLLTGLARPTSGTAWVAGFETTDGDDPARASFGYLPEEPAFYPWMTPREFLRFVGRLFQLPPAERERRGDELLELVDLTGAADRKIGGFSKGMRQRLGLAQALIHRPPVLFLDEPTSALDPAGRRDVLDLIERLKADTTIFLSSHILADVEQVCDTIGVIHEGELLLVADRTELLARYAKNVVVLEFDRDSLTDLDQFIPILETQSWVVEVRKNHNLLQLSVSDAAQGKQHLLRLVVENDLLLLRYEWVRPTLEEVFLTISKN